MPEYGGIIGDRVYKEIPGEVGINGYGVMIGRIGDRAYKEIPGGS